MSKQNVTANQLPDLTSGFLDDLKASGRSASTVRAYARDLSHLSAFIEDAGRPLDERAAADYGEWLIGERPAALTTQRRRLVAARRFLAFLAKTGHMAPAAQAAMVLPDPAAARREPPRRADILLLLAAPDVTTPIGLRDAIMFGLMVDHGLTPEELCSLRWSQFDVDTHQLSVPGRAAHIYEPCLADDLLRLREQAEAQNGEAPIFTSQRGGTLTPHGVAQRVDSYCADLGDRLTERLTPRRLREYAIAQRAMRTSPEDVEGFAAALGFRTVEGARRRWQQAWGEHDAVLLRGLLPLEEAAQTGGLDADTLRAWAAEGMPHDTDERGEVLVSLAAVQEWGARPRSGGRWVGAPRPPYGGEAPAEEEAALPPAAQALVGLIGATNEEEFAGAWRAYKEHSTRTSKVDVKAELMAIGRTFAVEALALSATMGETEGEPLTRSALALLLYGRTDWDLPEDATEAGYDERFLAGRQLLVSTSRALRLADMAVRQAWEGHDEMMRAAEEALLRSPGPRDEAGAAERAQAVSNGASRELALRMLDSPLSFRLWDELCAQSVSLVRLLLLVRPLGADLRRRADAAAHYYGLPEDADAEEAAFGALGHAILTAVLCAHPEAVERTREQTGAVSGARVFVLEHVKVSLIALLGAAGLLPAGVDHYALSAPPLLAIDDEGKFCRAVESRWEELQEYRDGTWDYLVLPKLGDADLLKYHRLVFTSKQRGDARVACEVSDYLVYLLKASPQALFLTTGRVGVARMREVLLLPFMPLINSQYAEMIKEIAELTDREPRDLHELVSAELATRVERAAMRLWISFDFVRGSGRSGPSPWGRGSTSFAAYLEAGIRRIFRWEQSRLARSLLWADRPLDGDEAGTDLGESGPKPPRTGALAARAKLVGGGGENLAVLSVEGPDGEEYLTTFWASVYVDCSERQLRSIDEHLRPRRVADVFGDNVPRNLGRLPPDGRLYRRQDLDPQAVQIILLRRKHRCDHFPAGHLSRGATAALLGCTPQTLVYWEKRGELRPAQIDGRRAYDAEQFSRARALIRSPADSGDESEEACYEALMEEAPGERSVHVDDELGDLRLIAPAPNRDIF